MAHKVVVFSVIGWMANYEGPSSYDPPPEGGGAFVRTKVGYEAWNFEIVGGECRAFVTTSLKKGGINLKRVGPQPTVDQIGDVLLVFLSRVPVGSQHTARASVAGSLGSGMRVVGWYNRATLYSEGKPSFHGTGSDKRKYQYNAVCAASDAVCVSEVERASLGIDFSGPGGIGQNRVRYPFLTSGKYDPHFEAASSWVAKVLAYIKTYEHTKSSPMSYVVYPDELRDPELYYEGAKTQVIVSTYERDPRLRGICIAKYGYACRVCKFDFEQKYGELGKEYIHVHHLQPLSAGKGKHPVDPIKDLCPVCPNCHAMLHRGAELLTIEELRAILHLDA